MSQSVRIMGMFFILSIVAVAYSFGIAISLLLHAAGLVVWGLENSSGFSSGVVFFMKGENACRVKIKLLYFFMDTIWIIAVYI